MRRPLQLGRIACRPIPDTACPQGTMPQSSPVRRASSSQIACARRESGNSWGARPCRRRLPKLTPLAAAHATPLSITDDRAPAPAQEIGRAAAHQPAADDCHVGRCGGHSASSWSVCTLAVDRDRSSRNTPATEKSTWRRPATYSSWAPAPSPSGSPAIWLPRRPSRRRVVLAGRNAFRLAWILTAGAGARADVRAPGRDRWP